MSFLKPKAAKSDSYNLNNELIKSTYSPLMQQGIGAGNYLASLLGIGDADPKADAGFENYLQKAGYEGALSRMVRGVTGGQAAAGLLRSGATKTRLLQEGTELNKGMFNNYLQQLFGLSGLGLQGGGLVANTGQKSTSIGGRPSTLGSIASTIGGIASIFSDRRLKTDIEKVGEFSDGLGIYVFRYIGNMLRRVGVMADEVVHLRPWALGPKIEGFSTVNYGAL